MRVQRRWLSRSLYTTSAQVVLPRFDELVNEYMNKRLKNDASQYLASLFYHGPSYLAFIVDNLDKT